MMLGGFWKWVNDYANLASVGGLLVSVIGFVLTISSAWAARRAALQARQSVLEIKSKLATQLVANEVTECLLVVKSLLETVGAKRWTTASRQCMEAVIRLTRLEESPGLTSEEQSRIACLIDDLGQVQSKIEEVKKDKETSRRMPEQTLKKLNDSVVHLSRVEAQLRHRSQG